MTVLYSVEGPLARITLNRPEKRNALSAELIEALKDTLALAAEDEEARVVLLTGAGNDFCSGADLAAFEKAADEGVLDHLAAANALAELFLALRKHPKPVIAAVRGRALAGGCGIATACDVILASASARFGYPEINIGFVPAMVMAMLRRSVGEKRAFELLTLGDPITSGAALEMGLITRVLPDETFTDDVDAYARALAAKSASALALTKRLLYSIDGMTFNAALESGVQTNALARMTEDARRGIERFVKKK
jgi:methylglutaconyl-CoA hydratase